MKGPVQGYTHVPRGMQPDSFEIVFRFADVVDDFVRLRVFPPEEARELLRLRRPPTRQGLQQLVLAAVIVGYVDEVFPRVRERAKTEAEIEAAERALYAVCTQVNPELDLKTASVDVAAAEPEPARLHLIAREGGGSAAAPAALAPGRLEGLEGRLREQVIGQDEAIGAVALALKKAAAGLRDESRPIGNFLFAGTTGVGKTELARAISRCLYESEERLLRVDCADLAQSHEAARLLGAPPGYVGFGEAGLLAHGERLRDGGVVLFDEVEKAHPKVHHLLLTLMDEGYVTDARGARIPFRNALVVFTSNLGVEEAEELRRRLGFGARPGRAAARGEVQEATKEALARAFRPEFISRLDEVIVFNPLTIAEARLIVEKLLSELATRGRKRGVLLTFEEGVSRFLAERGFDPDRGARELRRTVARYVEEPLSERIVRGALREGASVRVRARRGAIEFAEN